MRETRRQLEMLGELQRHLLPRVLPRPEGWQLAAHYAVGRWPGGDYYDFLPLPDGRLLLLVADASDQGAPSAAMVAMIRVVLHSCPLSSGIDRSPFCPLHDPVMQPPNILLGHLNQVLVENTLEEQYMTAFCALLDPVSGTLHYANAGHPAPRWWQAGAVQPLREAAGLPLGVDTRTYYHHKRILLGPGDVLVLYSDGLTAALNERGEMFGCERLDAALCEAAAEGAGAVKTAILAGLDDFLGGRELTDDVTLIVVQRQR